MENSILIGLSRQISLRNEMDVIANNLANQNTPGFRNQKMHFEEYIIPKARVNDFRPGDRKLSYVLDGSTINDLSSGALEKTGNPLDVAIKGKGWFVVETPEGEKITRAGGFEIDNEGTLVTRSGEPVLGEGGRITFGDDDVDFLIADDGTVSTSSGPLGKLLIVDFENERLIRHQGGSLYESSEPYIELEAPRVAQGFLERANTNSILEISRMVEVSRTYAAITNMLTQEDQLQRNAIAKLAEIPA